MDQNALQQILKHNGISQNRDRKYIWRTSQDSKVRSSHAEREGKIFDWDNPPPGGHPGQDFGCRCWAEPLEVDLSTRDSFEWSEYAASTLAAIRYSTGNVTDFFTGGLLPGGNLTVKNMGVENKLKQSTPMQKAREEFKIKLTKEIENKFINRRKGKHYLEFNNNIDTNFTDVVFVIGNTTLRLRFSGDVNIGDNNTYSFEGDLAVFINDRFEDALDLKDKYLGNQDIPGARIYSITGVWKEFMFGRGQLK